MKKVVVIGGGTGQSAILRGLKKIEGIALTTIVTVADDGGSTGRLRRQFHIPAMGDIRHVMCALAESESMLKSLMNFRFSGESDIGGHNLGNLILTALAQESGSFMNAIEQCCKVLNIKGQILPSTEQVITLYAMMQDGTIVRGESNIPKFKNRVERVFYEEDVVANEKAVQAILEADYIIYGIGSLYTSILPNLIIEGIAKALKQSEAKKIYICNAMSQSGETDYYSLEDHVQAIIDHTFPEAIDIVVAHNNIISPQILARYELMGSFPILVKEQNHDYRLLYCDMLSFENQLIRHDSEKIKEMLERLLKEDENVLHK